MCLHQFLVHRPIRIEDDDHVLPAHLPGLLLHLNCLLQKRCMGKYKAALLGLSIIILFNADLYPHDVGVIIVHHLVSDGLKDVGSVVIRKLKQDET